MCLPLRPLSPGAPVRLDAQLLGAIVLEEGVDVVWQKGLAALVAHAAGLAVDLESAR